MENKLMVEFAERLLGLTPEEFLGVAKLLQVRIVDEIDGKNVPRSGEDILQDMINHFNEMNWFRQKRFMKFMRMSTKRVKHHTAWKPEEDNNGVTTNNN